MLRQETVVKKVFLHTPTTHSRLNSSPAAAREGMEDSYETFEEELRPPRAEPPPRKSVRQFHRPEMYDARKFRQEMAPVPQQLRREPRIIPRDPSSTRTASSHKHLPVQNLNEVETPWENVTLNRCLFVAITILVVTSGFQRFHESLRGQRITEGKEDIELTVRRTGTLLHRGKPLEPEKTLWEVMFWWLPDLDDEEDEDDDDEVTRRKSRRGATSQTSRGLRNKPMPDKKLMKQREGKLKDRRAKKNRNNQIKDKNERDKTEEPNNTADDEDEGEGN